MISETDKITLKTQIDIFSVAENDYTFISFIFEQMTDKIQFLITGNGIENLFNIFADKFFGFTFNDKGIGEPSGGEAQNIFVQGGRKKGVSAGLRGGAAGKRYV